MNLSIPLEFVSLAGRWGSNQSANLLAFVWQGYDFLLAELPAGTDPKDLERSITQSLELRIRRAMSGDEPFDIQHGPYERETMMPPPSQPPQYDLAFVLRANERIMWPLEAKVLESDGKGSVRQYIKDVKNEFLTCRYAPFSNEGAMIGYLLSGNPAKAFENIATEIPCRLNAHHEFANRPHKVSEHKRSVKKDKPYPCESASGPMPRRFIRRITRR
jgi:hypothetical protein